MENQIYRLKDGDGTELEFWICDTNELNPRKDIKELAVTVLKDGMQLDFDMDVNAAKSLIKYIEDSLEYIKEYNKNSKPEN